MKTQKERERGGGNFHNTGSFFLAKTSDGGVEGVVEGFVPEVFPDTVRIRRERILSSAVYTRDTKQ